MVPTRRSWQSSDPSLIETVGFPFLSIDAGLLYMAMQLASSMQLGRQAPAMQSNHLHLGKIVVRHRMIEDLRSEDDATPVPQNGFVYRQRNPHPQHFLHADCAAPCRNHCHWYSLVTPTNCFPLLFVFVFTQSSTLHHHLHSVGFPSCLACR